MEFKNPITIFLLSVFLGRTGVDRFMIGDKGLGVFKLAINILSIICILILSFMDVLDLMPSSFCFYNVINAVRLFAAVIWLIDLCIIQKRTKEKNFDKLMENIM